MSALKVAFLSALVLDLVAALSVAVVAVDVGLRLDAGSTCRSPPRWSCCCWPRSCSRPCANARRQYHANQAGTVAASAALDIIAETTVAPTASAASLASHEIQASGSARLDGVTVRYPGRDRAALATCFFTVQPGEIVALVGRSGAGKSTVLAPCWAWSCRVAGRVVVGVGGELRDLAELDADAWRANTAWLPQRPMPTQVTVGDEVRLGDPNADDRAVEAACRECRTPALNTVLGEDGGSVSAGQRRRIALARVVLRVAAANRRGATAAGAA